MINAILGNMKLISICNSNLYQFISLDNEMQFYVYFLLLKYDEINLASDTVYYVQQLKIEKLRPLSYLCSFSGLPNSSIATLGTSGGLNPNSHRISFVNESTYLSLSSKLPKPLYIGGDESKY